jgi:hypothetical protein
VENHIITSIYINVKSNEAFTERETTIIKSLLVHTSAWAFNEGVFLNPPQTNDENPNCIFEIDLVFTKAIPIDKGEELKMIISKRITSVFRNAKLEEPTVELKEHVVSIK